MLQTVRDLFPFFAAFYLLDAFRYLSAAHRLLLACFPRGLRLKTEGLRLGAVLPGDREFSTSGLPIPLTPEGVFVPRSAEAGGTALYDRRNFALLRYAELSSLEVEHHTLVINGTLRLRFPSPAHAQNLAERLRELRDLPAAERGERLRQLLSHGLDLKEAERRLGEAERAVDLLTWLCWLFFAGLFVALPLVAFYEPAGAWVGRVLLFLAAVYLAVLFAAGRAVRRLHRGRLRCASGVWWTALLFPPAAVRVAGSLLRNVFYDFDHLTVVAAVLCRQTLLHGAAKELHCVRAAASEGGEPWQSYWQDRMEGLEGLLEMAGSSVAEALAPPPPRDPTAAAYCPLCGGEYRKLIVACESCAIRLVAFDTIP